jgi:hypothetical protein
MVSREDIKQTFSKELQWIKDEDLRNKVVDVWKEALDRGKWQSIDDVPFTLLLDFFLKVLENYLITLKELQILQKQSMIKGKRN